MVTFDGCTPMLIIPTIKNKLTNALEIMRSGDVSDDRGGGGGGLTFDSDQNDQGRNENYHNLTMVEEVEVG